MTNSSVGPIGGGFNKAFKFRNFTSSRHGGRRRQEATISGDDSSDENAESIDLELARGSSLWSRAEDFWHLVGWAFNCSILHPKRWARWKLLLELICEILEDDWKERLKLSQTEYSSNTTESEPVNKKHRREDILTESLIYKYTFSASEVLGRDRRMLRAIFADGTPAAVNEFREVFHNEPKENKKDTDTLKKREVDVNIDEGVFGDYLDVKDYEFQGESIEDPITHSHTTDTFGKRPTRPKRSRTACGSRPDHPKHLRTEASSDLLPKLEHDDITHLGDLATLALRQRLLSLLSGVSFHLPKEFMPISDLYSLFVEFIRHLPLPTFQLFVSPSVLLNFPSDAQTSLCEMLLFVLIENSAPASTESYISQNKLQKCYLPYTASTNSVIDNAKVSILLESLLRVLIPGTHLVLNDELKEAVEVGIMARGEKALSETKKGRSKQVADEYARVWLIESGFRMTHLMDGSTRGQSNSG